MRVGEKIQAEHLARKAVVYVRQSTPDQVRRHRESRRRQYALADHARSMGWRAVEVIDEDLGRSGASRAGRAGFDRLVGLVGLRQVGAIFSLEASRLARNNRDWYHLLDLCALMGTLIVDFDGVYDPRLPSDRLLLGLKGSMSEFELGLIRQRAHEALRQLAARGELLTTLPVGYVRGPDGRCEKDPDLRVRQAIQEVFRQFARCGSIRQVLLWFRQERIPLPSLVYEAGRRRIVWRLPVYSRIHRILTNPIYAGAYAFGRTVTERVVIDGQAVQRRGRRRPQAEWEVLIPHHHEGYIDWQTYQRNQRQIEENARMKGAAVRGPAQAGKSLLVGLLRCGHCGRKLHVSYSGVHGSVPRYSCRGAALNHGTGSCISFGGLAVDRAVEREVLRVVEPAALEASLAALAALEQQQDSRRTSLELALTQARYEAERARRQYDAVEPEHRLVAAELERRWNAALAEITRLEQELAALPEPPKPLSPSEREALQQLAEDLPALWRHPETDLRLKKRIVRLLIEEIMATVDAEQNRVELILRWAGGVHTRLRVRKNRTGQHRFATDRTVVDLVRELAQIVPDRAIAGILNRLGVRTGKGNPWTETRVRSLRSTHRIAAFQPGRPRAWLTLAEAASELGVSPMSVRRLIGEGIVPARQIVPHAPWMIDRMALESPDVQQAVAAIRQGRPRPRSEMPNQESLDLQDL